MSQSVSDYRWAGGLFVDNFAGGGGASTGISQALGKSPDIAVNHNAEALMMHEQNHPDTKHYNESVWDIDIKAVTEGKPVLGGWFSPDCTHFSVAKGGKPVKKAIRGLAWIVKKWWGQSDMAVIYMENVVEFMTWGPLIAARDKATKRVLKLVPDGTDKKGQPKFKTVVSEPGERVPYAEQALVPDKKRAGKTFKQFIRQMREAGYVVEWAEKGLVASDYGDPTTRKRFFLIARKDGLPIVWPAPTHGNPKLLPVKAGKLKPWRTAGENIDWSISCPSIFERDKPLAENTLRRIAKGIQKFVVEAGDEAFLVKTNHTGAGYDQFRGQGLDEPLQTITSKLGTGVAAVSLVPTGYGERKGQETRTVDVNAPLPTIVGTGKHGVVEAKLKRMQGDELIQATAAAMMKFRGDSAGSSCSEPLPTITAGAGSVRPAGAPHALGVMEVELASFIGTIDHTSNNNPATGMDEPIPTVTSKARHIQVAALLKHYTGVVGQTLDKPLPTITSVDHNSLMVAHVQRDFGNSVGHSCDEPLGSTTAGGGGHSSVIASSLVKLKGSSNHGQPLDVPLGTIAAQGNHFAQVEAMLIKYFGTGVAASLADPLDTITSKPRFGLVTIHSQQYQIVDIGMRMLEPHELYACQGFPAGYEHETVMGKKLPKYAQVRMVGNSVPPGLARALVQANTPKWTIERNDQQVA